MLQDAYIDLHLHNSHSRLTTEPVFLPFPNQNARKCNCAHSPKVRPQVRPPPRANRHKWYTSTYSSRWPRHLEKPLSKYICLSDTYLIVIGVEKTCRPSTSTTPRSTHAHHPSRLYFVLRNTSSGFWEHFRSLQTTTHTTARIPCANHLHRVLT